MLRSDGEPELEARKRAFRASAVSLGMPVFDEMSNAGEALAGLQSYEVFVNKRRPCGESAATVTVPASAAAGPAQVDASIGGGNRGRE